MIDRPNTRMGVRDPLNRQLSHVGVGKPLNRNRFHLEGVGPPILGKEGAQGKTGLPVTEVDIDWLLRHIFSGETEFHSG